MNTLPSKSPFQPIKTSKINNETNVNPQPKLSNVRESCQNMFSDALKETAGYPEGIKKIKLKETC
jgi:hypothetical protein